MNFLDCPFSIAPIFNCSPISLFTINFKVYSTCSLNQDHVHLFYFNTEKNILGYSLAYFSRLISKYFLQTQDRVHIAWKPILSQMLSNIRYKKCNTLKLIKPLNRKKVKNKKRQIGNSLKLFRILILKFAQIPYHLLSTRHDHKFSKNLQFL